LAYPTTVAAAVEGDVDEAVLTRLADAAGLSVYPVHGRQGKQFLRQRMAGYNRAAAHFPWVVLVDLDHDASCAPELRFDWVSQPASLLSFRVAVRAVEAWLIADQDRFARFLGISRARLPSDVEGLSDPKAAVVQLAAQSNSRRTREDIVPRPSSGRKTGPLYSARLTEFTRDVSNGWRPDVAAERCDSLSRCLRDLWRLREVLEEL
jgi:hypothetical protein